MQQAQALEAQQNLPAAIDALKKAVERQPGNAQARLQLGFLHAKVGDPAASETELRRALELGAPAARVLPALGAALLEMQQYQKLLKDISLPSDMLPEDLAVLVVQRGRAHLALGDTADARTQFLTAAQYRPVEARLGLALVAAVEGDLAGAERLVDEVIAQSPQSAAAWSVRGDLRQLRGDDRDAVEAYRRAVSLNPENVQAAASEAVLLIRAGDYEGARKLIERAQGLRPGDVVVNFARAVLALHTHDVAAGRESIDRVRRTVPDHPLTTVLDAALLAAAGQVEQSERVLSAYLRRDQPDPYARKLLAVALLAKQLPDQALIVLQPLLTTEQRDPAVLALAGRSELQTGALGAGRERLKQAVALAPGDARLRAELGLAQLALGDAPAAVEELRASARADRGGFDADLLLIAVLLSRMDVPAAVEAADALQAKLPSAAPASHAKGAVRLALGDPKGASAEFERALKLDPGYFPAVAALVRLDARNGAADSARSRLSAFLAGHGNHLQANLLMAELEAAGANIAGASALLLTLAQNHPSSESVSLMLAQLQLRSGEARAAISNAQRALTSNPRNAPALEALARAQRAAGDSSGAEATLSRLSALYPDSVDLLLLLADAQLAGKHRMQAETTFTKAVKLEPDNLDTLVAMAIVYLDAQRWDKAREVAGMLQRRDPRGVIAQALEGDIAMGQREYVRAAKAFERAVGMADSGELRVKWHQASSAAAGAFAPDAELVEWLRRHPEDFRTRRYLAAACLDAGRIRDAAEHYRLLVKADPRDARAMNNLAWAMSQLGEPGALDLAQRAHLLDPESAAAADTLGWLLLQSGKVDEAVPLLTAAASLDPATPAIRYHRAEALHRSGDLGAARMELKWIIETAVSSEYAAKASDLLRRIGS